MPIKKSKKQFTLIAHRGGAYDAPENTFEAFDLALEMGFDNIETDIQLSSDGRCILFMMNSWIEPLVFKALLPRRA